MTDKLRAHYVRQLKASGWHGNFGGWVYGPNDDHVQGWDTLLYRLARSMDRLGRALAFIPEGDRLIPWETR